MFSNEILSYSISLSPNFAQTREMLQKAFDNMPKMQIQNCIPTKVGNIK